MFNINLMDNDMFFQRFRFRLGYISHIAGFFDWTAQINSRNGYRCDALAACCVVLGNLAAPVRFREMEKEFEMHHYALSDIFWESIARLVSSKGHKLSTLQSGLLAERAQLDAEDIQKKGARLEIHVILCTVRK